MASPDGRTPGPELRWQWQFQPHVVRPRAPASGQSGNVRAREFHRCAVRVAEESGCRRDGSQIRNYRATSRFGSPNHGIPDSDDPCPIDPENLCDEPDSDGDGIPDTDDSCPFDPENLCNEPPPPPAEAQQPIVMVESGVIGKDECFITVQKSLEGQVQDGDVLREIEIITVISACAADDGSGISVETSVETFIVACVKDGLLSGAQCVTTAENPD